MSVAPFAVWKPLPAGVNHSTGGMTGYDGCVLHIMQGTLIGTDAWFRDPKAQASAHFGIDRNGWVCQWVDTADKAWAQAGGNSRNISIENEGMPGDSLTAAQAERAAEILAWAHTVHGVPLVVNDDPGAGGLGWHGMGGAAWGGHTSCPGDPIKAQRAGIVARAQALLNLQPVPEPYEEADMLSFSDDRGTFLCDSSGAVFTFDMSGNAVDGGRFLGGLNGHPAWQAGPGLANGAPFAFGPTPADAQGRKGYFITTRDAKGVFHPYVFPGSGALK